MVGTRQGQDKVCPVLVQEMKGILLVIFSWKALSIDTKSGPLSGAHFYFMHDIPHAHASESQPPLPGVWKALCPVMYFERVFFNLLPLKIQEQPEKKTSQVVSDLGGFQLPLQRGVWVTH